MDVPLTELIPPQTEVGGYRVVGHFASGGMGDVYEVIDPLMNELFAMKVLRENDISSTRAIAIQNFLDEARTTIRLRHNNIVTLHRMGVEPIRGRLYFIMDYIGLTPARRNEVLSGTSWFIAESVNSKKSSVARTPLTLDNVLQKQGRIQEDVVHTIALDIADALQYAHTFSEGSVVHCDLKPGNILLREDGHAVVVDFGISQAQHTSEPNEISTTSIRGTPDYMAPEQWDSKSKITPAVDIYAYGVLICRILTGTFPVGIWKRPSELGMNPGWDILIEKCIQKDPRKRWKSMLDIANWVRDLPQYAQRIKRRQAIRHTLLILGAIALFTLIISIILSTIVKTKLSNSKDAPAYTWEKATVNPDAFINRDLSDPHPLYMYAGTLVYPKEADPMLKTPTASLPGVDVLVIPEQITSFEEGFFTRFPRLEYIVCDEDNATFVSRDGILYRKGTPLEVVAVPPKLHGTITLPEGITRLEVPWQDAGITGKTLTARGAYNRPLTLTSPTPITWILPKR